MDKPACSVLTSGIEHVGELGRRDHPAGVGEVERIGELGWGDHPAGVGEIDIGVEERDVTGEEEDQRGL